MHLALIRRGPQTVRKRVILKCDGVHVFVLLGEDEGRGSGL